jgi:hypothetical protein
MSETRKTMTYAGVAFLLLLLAFVTTPRRTTPDDFVDRGESFFPEFTDPNVATTLEVVEFDEETASARPFKVTFRDGKWTIPSHHNYPADGKDRLAETAAGVIAVTKDDFRSSNAADHEACGVLDPLDETVTILKGRGKRVTVKDAADQVLADLIIGDKVEDRTGLRFVRVPSQKSVYVTGTDLDISTQFADWIEPDLLKVEKDNIATVTLKDYSINERFRTVDQRDTLVLKKDSDEWSANRMSSRQEVDTVKMNDLLRAIDELSILGVRPKPEGLSQDLKQSEGSVPISQANLLSLQSKGYYFTRDGNLLSNEGELEFATSEGLRYILRFGEVLYGTGEAISAGTEDSDQKDSGPGENRYLFVTAEFDDTLLPEPPKAANTDFQSKPEEELTDEDKKNKELHEAYSEWEEKIEEGKKLAEDLNARFAEWYYVISSDSFDKINLTRGDLVKRKES